MRGGQDGADILYGEFIASRTAGLDQNWGIFFDQIDTPLEVANTNWNKIIGYAAPEEDQKEAVNDFIWYDAPPPSGVSAKELMALCFAVFQGDKARIDNQPEQIEEAFKTRLKRIEEAYQVSFSPGSVGKQYADVLLAADEAFHTGRSKW